MIKILNIEYKNFFVNYSLPLFKMPNNKLNYYIKHNVRVRCNDYTQPVYTNNINNIYYTVFHINLLLKYRNKNTVTDYANGLSLCDSELINTVKVAYKPRFRVDFRIPIYISYSRYTI